MRYVYSDVGSGEQLPSPEEGTYSVMELLHEHEQRYVLVTDAGAIILRRMPWRMARTINAVSDMLHPGRRELALRAMELLPYVQGVPEDAVDPDKVRELQEIEAQLRISDMSALGVIVAPAVATMDDVDKLYDQLSEEDASRLDLCIQVMSAVRDRKDIDGTALEIAKASGLQLISEDMLQAMTVSQASYLMGRIATENRRINAALGVREVK